MNIVLLLVGTALVLWGADKFTDGACGVARRWNVSELVIGLTIVAMGTSLPELIVSLFSSIRGSGDMSVGNIVGSNIFNTLVIIGASATAMKIAVSRITLYRDISLSFGVAVVLFLMGRDGELTRVEGVLLLGVFAIFLYNLFMAERKNKKNQTEAPEQPKDIEPVWKLLLFLVIGVASLVGGGQLLVNNAAELARSWGVSESVIGLTILAGGTSLPELATSVVAARKGSNDLALGNALGSNIFNITLVLGLCAVEDYLQAEVQVGVVTHHLLDIIHIVAIFAKDSLIDTELNHRTVALLDIALPSIRELQSLSKAYGMGLTIAHRARSKLARKHIYGLHTHTIQTYGLFEGFAIVLTTRIHLTYGCRQRLQGDASAIIADSHHIIFNRDFNPITRTHNKLINRVIDGLLDKHIYSIVGLRAITQLSDIHTWSQTQMFARREGFD